MMAHHFQEQQGHKDHQAQQAPGEAGAEIAPDTAGHGSAHGVGNEPWLFDELRVVQQLIGGNGNDGGPHDGGHPLGGSQTNTHHANDHAQTGDNSRFHSYTPPNRRLRR